MMNSTEKFSTSELALLRQCITLAEEALDAGDQPFGSILVSEENKIIAKARNSVNESNQTAHPEIKLARWAANNLTKEERKRTRMFTSGEHCPMCAAAHGWVNLGPIIYIHSGQQLGQWLTEFEAPASPINFYPIEEIINDINLRGPVPELVPKMKELHRRYYSS